MIARLVFGLVVPAAGSGLATRVDLFARALGRHLGITVEHRHAASYEALGDDVRAGRIDLAWLPPIVFIRLGEVVRPVGSILRGGAAAYESALVTLASSPWQSLENLGGARAGWVDRSSASGYVLPRVNLVLRGIDPQATFQSETFHGSHRSLMQALRDGLCDVAGTYTRLDERRQPKTGAWSEVEGAKVRVLATFGEVPPDVLAVRSFLAPRIGDAIFAALRDICLEDMALVESVFGGQELKEGLAPGYDALRQAMDLSPR